MPRIVALLLVVVSVGTLICGCGRGPTSPDRGKGDLRGTVLFLEGDFMPINPAGTTTPVRREMRIHELASKSSGVVPSGTPDFYKHVNTRLVATVWSDASGHFQVALPSGRYSLFSVEDSLLYASEGDLSGHIFPVEVHRGASTSVVFSITYRATF